MGVSRLTRCLPEKNWRHQLIWKRLTRKSCRCTTVLIYVRLFCMTFDVVKEIFKKLFYTT
ncbi:hypothetical protein AKO1_003868 [Acrasis kona]|uniref:Uncharacterized protein n=1 Tax=Acrasis kona TaxID=1008807 RepID=A0AAW2ZJC6_9EUKA